MWGFTPRSFLYFLLTLQFLGFAAEDSRASRCSDVYPGSLQGPPPEWTFWGDGAACYVRWNAGKNDEKDLLAQCRNTPGVRFVHFEPDRGAGSICVFKLLDGQRDDTPQEQARGSSPPRQREELQSTHYRKADAESPLLDRIQLLVTTWTEKCLNEEETKSHAVAARCWRNGAADVEALTSNNRGVLSDQLQAEIAALKAKWLHRAEQLKPYIVQAVKAPVERIEPRPPRSHGPDPRRLAETAVCSSTRLGDYRRCVREPVPTGPDTYAIGLRAGCRKGALAAIRTRDAEGRCIRKVVAILPDERRPVIRSYGEASILDAISYRDARTFECYARRHDDISCNGKVDYAATLPPSEEALEDAAADQPTEAKNREPRPRRKKNVSLLTRLSKGVKNLFRPD